MAKYAMIASYNQSLENHLLFEAICGQLSFFKTFSSMPVNLILVITKRGAAQKLPVFSSFISVSEPRIVRSPSLYLKPVMGRNRYKWIRLIGELHNNRYKNFFLIHFISALSTNCNSLCFTSNT